MVLYARKEHSTPKFSDAISFEKVLESRQISLFLVDQGKVFTIVAGDGRDIVESHMAWITKVSPLDVLAGTAPIPKQLIPPQRPMSARPEPLR